MPSLLNAQSEGHGDISTISASQQQQQEAVAVVAAAAAAAAAEVAAAAAAAAITCYLRCVSDGLQAAVTGTMV